MKAKTLMTPFRALAAGALVSATRLGFRKVTAAEWPDGARVVVERDGQYYYIETGPWKDDDGNGH